jgi:hypothetical protein
MSPRLTENPWFWLMLFGSLGAVGVVVIGPKYGPRLARMERMAETRDRVKAAQELGVSATEVRKLKPGESGDHPAVVAAAGPPAGTSPGSSDDGGPGSSADGSSVEKGPIEPYVDADFQSKSRLGWLLALMVVLMLAGTVGTIVSRRRQAV